MNRITLENTMITFKLSLHPYFGGTVIGFKVDIDYGEGERQCRYFTDFSYAMALLVRHSRLQFC